MKHLNNGEAVWLLGVALIVLLGCGGRLQRFVDQPSAKMWRSR
jgi:hypothetical protein